MITLATVILAFVCLNTYVHGESYLVCNRTDIVVNSSLPSLTTYSPRNKQLKKGEIGEKGRWGLRGQYGERGVIDYALVNATIKQHIKKLMAQLGKRKPKVAAVAETITNIPESCPIRYNERCIVPVVDAKMYKLKAEKICSRMSGRLANIYDKAHFDLIVNTIRRNYMDGLKFIDFRTGMTIYTETQLSDGKLAPYLRWFSTFPNTNPGSTNVILRVRKSRKNLEQYFYQHASSYAFYALCEIV